MSKVQSLIKKAAVFEKLATHGSRKEFLQSLAQDSDIKATARSLVSQVQAIMNRANVTDEKINSGLGNVSLFGKTDPDSLRQAADAARSLMSKISPLAYADAAKDQNALMGLAARLNSLAKSQETKSDEEGMQYTEFGPGGNTGDTKTDVIKAYPPIATADQEAVFRFVTVNGLGLPGKVDGKLGKETRQALEAIKNYFAKVNPQNPRMSDAQAITAAKFNK